MVKIPLGYPLKLALDCHEDIGRPQYPRGLNTPTMIFLPNQNNSKSGKS